MTVLRIAAMTLDNDSVEPSTDLTGSATVIPLPQILPVRPRSPVEDGGLLLFDVVAGHVAALLPAVHDAPPVLRVVQQQQPLLLAQTQLVRALRLVVILGRHPALFGAHPLACRAVSVSDARQQCPGRVVGAGIWPVIRWQMRCDVW